MNDVKKMYFIQCKCVKHTLLDQCVQLIDQSVRCGCGVVDAMAR